MSALAVQLRKEESAVRLYEWNEQLTDSEIPQVARAAARLDASFRPEETGARALASRVAYCYARPDWFVSEFFPGAKASWLPIPGRIPGKKDSSGNGARKYGGDVLMACIPSSRFVLLPRAVTASERPR